MGCQEREKSGLGKLLSRFCIWLNEEFILEVLTLKGLCRKIDANCFFSFSGLLYVRVKYPQILKRQTIPIRGQNIFFRWFRHRKQPKIFGNECNVMAEILLSRYDLYNSKKLQTRIFTSLLVIEIEKNYGNRVRSRLREMINLILIKI